MMVMMTRVFFLGAAVLLASCGTPEFRAEKTTCTADWMTKIPARLEKELYNETRSRQVPTGQVTCTTSGYVTNCNQIMRTEYYTVPAVRTVDRNKPRRDAQIDSCTQNMCVKKFGNPECKA